ncbi:hypothetical protein F5Y07DRAFT_284747 [Xylaria sp. FL0933]|nr:hypothetical protein F5Y07DRAFT_284747 [Xylaria sp. FL0933]
MGDSTLLEGRQAGMSLHNLFNRSESAVMALSSGAIVAMTVGGSVFIFLLIIGPVLVYRAKRQDRDRAADFPTSNFVEVGDIKGSRRLRKKTASEGVAYSVTTDADSIAAPTKHLSVPNLPSIFSSPGNWRISGPFTSNRPWDSEIGDDANSNGGENGVRAGTDGYSQSPEKHRGYVINQNRRKTSWVDEDTLHGPRVSPKKNGKRKSSWFPGNELTRSLSRHLSFRRYGAPELARSPTLPCIETRQEQALGSRGTMPEEPLANRKTRSTENPHISREYETQAEPRFPVRQPLQQGGSLNSYPKAQPIGTTVPSSQSHDNMVMNAAQQLAGRARVPSVDAAANGQRYSRFQQSNTDADLQAILRRTAERLQDGNPSTRRQTLMLSSSSCSRWPDQTGKDSNRDCGCGKDHTRPGDTTPSPARSQRSAPAAVSYSELEGCSPKIQQSLSQNSAPWQTHRRTHTQVVSPISTRSAPGNAAATPSRGSTRGDGPHTFLPSPNHMVETSFSYSQSVSDPQSYSPASEKSSALSTVYSEDERTPPPSGPKAANAPGGGTEMERRAMNQALHACDAFDGGQMRRNDHGEQYGASLATQENIYTNHSHQPRYIQERALEQVQQNTYPATVVSASIPKDAAKQAAFRISPKALPPSTQAVKAAAEDPFTTYTTPKRHTPQRLSQVFSPLPAELPSNSVPAKGMRPPSETPTPSPSHRRVVPPPYRLRPVTSSPTLGQHEDPQLQIEPPSREPSPAISEGGLSSVYDSYRYSRYSDNFEGSQALSRISASTMLTVPTAETSPTESAWDDDTSHIPSIDSRKNYRGIESGVGASRPIQAGAYAHFVGHPGSSAVDCRVKAGYAVEGTLPLLEQSRQISYGNVSTASGESAYSQDEDEQDRLGPLLPFRPATTAPGKHAMRVTSAVAELRRMNSQVSCVSGYSTATTAVGGDVSPTLPALRGGGCSPGKKGAGGGVKNYLSLGNSPPRERDESEDIRAESTKYNAVARVLEYEQRNEKTTVPPVLKDTVTIRRGGRGRSRGSTIVESFEQDLDRARKVLRESGGYNLQATRELPTKSASPRGPRAHATKLSQEQVCTSPMGLGLYDNKGFLRSSVTSQDLTGHI